MTCSNTIVGVVLIVAVAAVFIALFVCMAVTEVAESRCLRELDKREPR